MQCVYLGVGAIELKNQRMRITITFFILFLLTSCFVFDKIPEINIKIDKPILSEIDSIILIDSLTYSNTEENYVKVTDEFQDYRIMSFESSVRIKLKLKNSSYITSDLIEIINDKDKIFISKHENKYEFNIIKESKFKKYATIFFIVLLLVLLTKIPVALLIISPVSKFEFLKHYGGLNLIYLVLFTVCLLIFSEGFVAFLYPFYFIVLASDLLFLTKYYNDKGTARPIIAGIISNLLFLTLGQFIITFAIMIIL